MNSETEHLGTPIFAEQWQAWLIVRHLLPAGLQRALVLEVVDIASGHTIAFADLFEETSVDHPIWAESWLIRPRPDVGGYGRYLQGWIQSIVWENDQSVGGYQAGEAGAEYLNPVLLDYLTLLSAMDFGWPEGVLEPPTNTARELQPSTRNFLHAVGIARTSYLDLAPIEYWSALETDIERIEMPLRAVVVKHIADLCADVDAWDQALCGYEKAEDLLDSWQCPPVFKDVTMAWKSIALQCRACACAIVKPRVDVAALFDSVVAATALTADPLRAVNAGLDALVAQSWAANRKYGDPRASVLSAPLVHTSHDASHALGYWLNREYDDADRRFWSLLRRQIALGAASETRRTKGWYARNMVEQVARDLEKHEPGVSFETAVRLLIEAEKPQNVERIIWTQALVDNCVVELGLIERLAHHALRFEGARMGRVKVLIELFKTWTVKLTPSRVAPVIAMWRHVARFARDFAATFNSSTDVGRAALGALQEMGAKRPELRTTVANDVGEAIVKKLGEEFSWGRSEAIETALRYVDAFESSVLRKVAEAILDVLIQEDPDKELWPLTRPALRFLVDPVVRRRLGGEDQLNRRCLEQIFRFGLAEGSGQREIFFHLADFDPKLLEEEATRNRLKPALEHVRQRALQVNASDVTEYIRALFVAPFIAQYEGIADAFRGLDLVLDSARGEHESIGLARIDDPLLVLVQKIDSIRSALGDQSSWFDQRLDSLAESLACLWRLARTKPLVFAPFSIPPRTKASEVVVHNCAFACLRLAQAIGRPESIRQALAEASRSPALGNAIRLARATHASGQAFAQSELEDLSDEDRESFYQSLGRRLTQLARLQGDAAQQLCERLIDGILQLGPRSSDAAVLVCAANLGLHDYVRNAGLRMYTKRIQADRENRLLLLPIVDLFLTAEMDEEPG